MGRDELVLQWKQKQDLFFVSSCQHHRGSTTPGSGFGTHPSLSGFWNYMGRIRTGGKLAGACAWRQYNHIHLLFIEKQPKLQEAHL